MTLVHRQFFVFWVLNKRRRYKLSTRQILVGTLILVANLFLLSASTAFAQDFGNRDFDCDGDHGGADTQARYLSSYGISFVSTATEAEEPDCDCYYNNPDGVKTILDRDPIDLAEKLEQVKGKPL